MKTAIGIVTFGNADFTRLALREIMLTAKRAVDVCLVIGQPGDFKTALLAEEYHLPVILHDVNKGFPASLNDLYDVCFQEHDNLIIMGNDVVPYPGAIDAMIDTAAQTDYEWIGASQYDVKSLVRDHPEAAAFFKGPTFEFTDFSARPWDLHGVEHLRPHHVEDAVIRDVHNLCLFKRSVFEKIGYVDVNFYPAYFSDNDYCRRGWKEGLKTCSLDHAAYFHFWSRTIHQGDWGDGKSDGHRPPLEDRAGRFFRLNEEFYRLKWGGSVQGEAWTVPFDGLGFELDNTGLFLPPRRKIATRDNEEAIVNYWKKKGGEAGATAAP